MQTPTHLITSGCSFSACGKWPSMLAEKMQLKLYNFGQNSCGNDWISRSVIYQAATLIENGIDPSKILIIVMWSGLDRKSLFVSKKENVEFDSFIGQNTPFHFIGAPINQYHVVNDRYGYIPGKPNCMLGTQALQQHKNNWYSYLTVEELVIESYEHFLRLQWFCMTNNVRILNVTFGDIMHYPNFEFVGHKKTGKVTKNYYETVTHLHNMINFNQWKFHDETGGQYEYTMSNNLSFDADKLHPSLDANMHYVDNFLIPVLSE